MFNFVIFSESLILGNQNGQEIYCLSELQSQVLEDQSIYQSIVFLVFKITIKVPKQLNITVHLISVTIGGSSGGHRGTSPSPTTTTTPKMLFC